MNTYIAYDRDTKQVLGFITNDYTTLEETSEVFKNFENYEVTKTNIELPQNFEDFKVIIKNGQVIGFETIIRVYIQILYRNKWRY